MSEFAASTSPCPKIIELIRDRTDKWISLEFFPPKTEAGVNKLNELISNLKAVCSKSNPDYPMFVDVTWGAGGSTADLTFDLCVKAKQNFGVNPNMHLTCTNMDAAMVDKALKDCRDTGITNIVALRGDPPVGQEKWTVTEGGFTCALDLVRHIRQLYSDYFCLSVSGYPEGHPNSFTTLTSPEAKSSLTLSEQCRCSVEKTEDGTEVIYVCRDEDYQKELNYLKEKVEAGADCIITQMFFDVNVYEVFVQDCRKMNITVPIIPGIMCVASYGGFKRMTAFCKSRVPESVMAGLEAVKESEEKVRQYGIEMGANMCRRLLELGAPGLHLYTLNMSVVTKGILRELGYISTEEEVAIAV